MERFEEYLELILWIDEVEDYVRQSINGPSIYIDKYLSNIILFLRSIGPRVLQSPADSSLYRDLAIYFFRGYAEAYQTSDSRFPPALSVLTQSPEIVIHSMVFKKLLKDHINLEQYLIDFGTKYPHPEFDPVALVQNLINLNVVMNFEHNQSNGCLDILIEVST